VGYAPSLLIKFFSTAKPDPWVFGRMSLAELGKAADGLDYAVVSKTVARFGRRLSSDASLREQLARIEQQLSK
jgi:hypothetical protein